MTDQKMIASMVGDFYGVYLGKSMLGIQGLLKKYHNHKFIITLISNLETTVEIDMHKAMHEIYDFYGNWKKPLYTGNGAVQNEI